MDHWIVPKSTNVITIILYIRTLLQKQQQTKQVCFRSRQKKSQRKIFEKLLCVHVCRFVKMGYLLGRKESEKKSVNL